MSAVQSPDRTDWLDGIGEDVCHIFTTGASHADCGVPRAEQPEHGRPTLPARVMAVLTHCPACGNRHCSICLAVTRREAGL